MEFIDRALTCINCGGEFVFSAGEQLFYQTKEFSYVPKRCAPCRAKRHRGFRRAHLDVRTTCAIRCVFSLEPTMAAIFLRLRSAVIQIQMGAFPMTQKRVQDGAPSEEETAVIQRGGSARRGRIFAKRKFPQEIVRQES